MATDAPEPESAEVTPSLPEKIAPSDIEALNHALAAFFRELRFARTLPPGETHGRLGAVVALRAVWSFLVRFESALAETLHWPLLSLHGALLALNENNVEPILKPAKRTGRATSSPRRYALIGMAVGAAQLVELTGLSAAKANKLIARKLTELGVKPTRGTNDVTAHTLRRWRKKISEVEPLVRSLSESNLTKIADSDNGWINASLNARSMVTQESCAKVAALAPDARRLFVLLALEHAVSQMNLADPAS
jgi:hypothetical protein